MGIVKTQNIRFDTHGTFCQRRKVCVISDIANVQNAQHLLTMKIPGLIQQITYVGRNTFQNSYLSPFMYRVLFI
jgi:hypothetical protein